MKLNFFQEKEQKALKNQMMNINFKQEKEQKILKNLIEILDKERVDKMGELITK